MLNDKQETKEMLERFKKIEKGFEQALIQKIFEDFRKEKNV